jgi:hypothetical protein
MDPHAVEQSRGLNVFRLFALFVLARVVIDFPERLAPAFRNNFTGDFYELLDYLDTAYLLLAVVAVCLYLRRRRNVIVHSELAPLCAILAFALLLPYLRQLLADALMTIVSLIAAGQLGGIRPFDRIISGEPVLRAITQTVFGIGAALVWCGALRWIFGADVQQARRRGIRPARRMWLLGPLLLYAMGLPVLTGIGILLFDGTWRWFGVYDLNYAIGMCILAAFLYALRDRLKRLELSPLVIVLAFVLLAELAHHLIDREILHTVRHLSREQMPWEEALPLRRPINYVLGAIYQTVLTVIGAAAAYGILRAIFGSEFAAVVRRASDRPPN